MGATALKLHKIYITVAKTFHCGHNDAQFMMRTFPVNRAEHVYIKGQFSKGVGQYNGVFQMKLFLSCLNETVFLCKEGKFLFTNKISNK